MTKPIYPLEPIRLGRYFFGLAVLASGLMQLVNAEFVRLTLPLPSWLSWPSFWARAVGVLLVLLGSAIVAGFMARAAALILCALLVLILIFRSLPEVIGRPMTGFVWTNPCKILAIGGGALLIAASARHNKPGSADWAQKLKLIAPLLLAAFLLVCGVQHFVYAAFVDTLVPVRMPLEPRFWTYLTGIALIAGGAGLMIPRAARLAAILSGAMIFLWVILLHIPRSIELKTASEVAGIFEALAISGAAFMAGGFVAKET